MVATFREALASKLEKIFSDNAESLTKALLPQLQKALRLSGCGSLGQLQVERKSKRPSIEPCWSPSVRQKPSYPP